MSRHGTVAVVIAVYNGSDTIGRAIRSALEQAEVTQLFVVDDASTDGTDSFATEAAGGDPRYQLIRQPVNLGPSAARNYAIDHANTDWIAILDADDAFMPDRFANMPLDANWDLIADNIMFVVDHDHIPATAFKAPAKGARTRLSFHDFVAENISRPDKVRGELGFLKPVMKREMLTSMNLRYREECRLGEDFLLYAEAMAKGARFEISEYCGYVALRRENSLSNRHGACELQALAGATADLLERVELAPRDFRVLTTHLASVRQKMAHRNVLDVRQKHGVLCGLWSLARNPFVAPSIVRDRLGKTSHQSNQTGLLLDAKQFLALARSAKSELA